MKKLISHIILGLLMLFIVSCMPQNEVGTPFHKGQEVTIYASMPYNNSEGGVAYMPDKQRVSGLDSHPMTSQGAINLYWSEGDEIAVVVGEEEATFTLASGAGTSNATFEGQMPASGSSFKVHYPIDYHDSLLAKQSYVENGFGDGLMKMSTRNPGTLDGGFTLYADNALLGLQFAGDAVVSKIVMTNVETQATYILDCSKQLVSTAGGRLFYIVVRGETEEKDNYSWANYKWCKGTEKTLTKYCSNAQYGANGFKDGLKTLLPEDDAAHVHWGGIWRMPTGEEQEELIKNCNWEWTNTNGVMGYKVTSQINGNQIFIPAAGFKNGNQYNSRGTGNDAWGSTLTQPGRTLAQCINFVGKNVKIVGTYFQRYYGFSIRPVCEP